MDVNPSSTSGEELALETSKRERGVIWLAALASSFGARAALDFVISYP